MRIAVENYRGVRTAIIDLAGDNTQIALVAGLNGSGKSSICQAAAAALCSVGIPLIEPGTKPGDVSPLVTKKDSRALVHDGATSGSATLTGESDGDGVTVAWPGGTVTARGNPPACSTLAAGLIRFSDLPSKSRSLLLINALKAAPTKADVLELAGSAASKRIEDAWPDIERVGWDAAAQRFAEAATKGKGRWEEITGERYGIEKAKAWRPLDWQPDLDQANADDLRAAEKAARADRDAALARTAVDRSERQKLQEKAALVPELEKLVSELESAYAAAAKQAEAATTARDSLPVPDGESGQDCPWCGKAIGIDRRGGGQIILHRFERTISKEEFDRLSRAHQTACAEKNEADRAADARRTALDDARRNLNDAEKAASDLGAMPGDEPAAKAGQDVTSMDAVEGALTAAARRVKMHEAVTSATRVAAAISRDNAIADLLRPTGIRQRKLEQMLATLNGRLADICSQAGWPKVEVTSDLDLLCDGRRIILAADSEIYRCDIALQIAVGEHDGSGIVIIDGADKLDRDNRNGMFNMLLRLRCKAIVAMTAPSRDVLPDLAAAGIGRTYWIEAGTAVAIGAAQAMAAE